MRNDDVTRASRLALALAASLGLAACSDAVPCVNCPRLGGTYSVTWLDAGTADAPCPTPGPRPPTLSFEQSGSRVTADVDGVRLGGTLYDSYDLAMTGLSADVSYALKALVIPTGTSLDGGIRLTGSLTVRRTGADGGACEARDGFEGTRQR